MAAAVQDRCWQGRRPHGVSGGSVLALCQLSPVLYVRYEATTPNARGHHTGIFGLANGLLRRGELDPEDQAWLQANNSWIDETCPDPGLVDSTLSIERSTRERPAGSS